MTAFLKELLFQEGGAYTLFGDKPMTSTLLFIGSQDEISMEFVSDEAKATATYCKFPTYEDWITWKKYIKNCNLKNFVFAEHPCPLDPSQKYILFINKKELRKILSEEKPLFVEMWGKDFSIDWAFQELENHGSEFWKRVLMNHILAGILYGYGKENAVSFAQNTESGKLLGINSNTLSDNLSSEELLLPTFRIFDDDQIVKKYQVMRELIQEQYSNKSFLKETIKKLNFD